jgi:hypothetical protein
VQDRHSGGKNIFFYTRNGAGRFGPPTVPNFADARALPKPNARCRAPPSRFDSLESEKRFRTGVHGQSVQEIFERSLSGLLGSGMGPETAFP